MYRLEERLERIGDNAVTPAETRDNAVNPADSKHHLVTSSENNPAETEDSFQELKYLENDENYSQQFQVGFSVFSHA